MKIILSTNNLLTAMALRSRLINSIKGEVDGVKIQTWSYVKSGDNFDILYHNPSQYVQDPLKNVLFRLQLDGENVVLSTAWWSKNPEPSKEMQCYHVGRLTEMLLYHFSDNFIKYSVAI